MTPKLKYKAAIAASRAAEAELETAKAVHGAAWQRAREYGESLSAVSSAACIAAVAGRPPADHADVIEEAMAPYLAEFRRLCAEAATALAAEQAAWAAWHAALKPESEACARYLGLTA